MRKFLFKQLAKWVEKPNDWEECKRRSAVWVKWAKRIGYMKEETRWKGK